MNKPDDGRQHRRQSKDFKEVWNVQTEMNVKELEWDKIFHDWKNPENCSGRKRVIKCKICEMIDTGVSVDHLKPNNTD